MASAKDETDETRSAYSGGYVARSIDNRPLTANPYLCATSPANVTLGNWWRQGWLDAASDQLPGLSHLSKD